MATASPASPGQSYEPRRRRGSVVWPALLIFVGVLLLLQNLGIVSWSVWASLFRLWPLVLVLIGLELLLGSRLHAAGRTALVLLVVLGGVALALATGFGGGTPGGAFETRNLVQSLDGARQGNVRLQFGAGRLTVGAFDGRQPDQLARATFFGPADFLFDSSYQVRNGTGDLRYGIRGSSSGFNPLRFLGSQGGGMELTVELNPDLPLALDLETGASDSRIDISTLKVNQLDLQAGASQTWLRLPEAAGTTSARVRGGASSVTIEVPQGVAAQIQYQGGLSNVEVDESRFPSVGNRQFRSPDYATAQNRVDLAIEAGASHVVVR